jgi:hypothetical protein
MSFEVEHVIATFASGIVTARGATSVAAIREAWSDARWILFPDPSAAEYRDWQQAHGEKPATIEEAEAQGAALTARKKQMSKAAQNYTVL